MTTWGDLRAGDVILDKNDVPWTVEQKSSLFRGAEVRVTLKHEDGRTPIVVKPATEPVTRKSNKVKIGEDYGDLKRLPPTDDWTTDPNYVDLDSARSIRVVQDAFGEDKVELIASETTEEQQAREAATPDEPLRLPLIDHPASLRSHLYIVHEFYVADVDSTLALQEHHRKQHADYPDQGTPHTHKEATS